MSGRPSEPPTDTGLSTPPDLLGRVLAGRYRLDARLGAGGFGVVYRGWDAQAQRGVAIKVLREELGARKSLQRRFAREAKALMALDHPNIVAIVDYGVANGMPFLAMELLEGHGLDRELKQAGVLAEDRARFVLGELLCGIGYMHRRGLVHRDLKPGNVFVQVLKGGQERIKLLDFGLAKFLEAEDPSDIVALTRTGEVFGTPAYMPPEQLAGERPDYRADLYSAAVMMFQMLCGRRPFEGAPHDVLRMVLVEPAPTLQSCLQDRKADPALEAWLQKALAKKPELRFETAAAFQAALDALPRPMLVHGDSLATTQLTVDDIEQDDTLLSGTPGMADGGVAPSLHLPGPVGRLTSALATGVRRLVVASATLISILSVLIIGAAAVVIFVFSDGPQASLLSDGPQVSPEALPRVALANGAKSRIDPARAGEPARVLPEPAHGAPAAAAPTNDLPAASRAAPVAAAMPTPTGGPVEAAAQTQPAQSTEPPTVQLGGVTAPRAAGQPTGTATGPGSGAQQPVAAAQSAVADAAINLAGPVAAALYGTEPVAPAVDPPSQPSPLADRAPVRPRARDPFRRGVPKQLARLRRRILKGAKGDDRTIATLRRYNRAHPDDSRGHLLMARLYLNRLWYRDAISQYGFAFARDPASRGHRAMLTDLISLAGASGTHREASALVRKAYGPEAKRAVQRAIGRAEEGGVKVRLKRLNKMLEAPK